MDTPTRPARQLYTVREAAPLLGMGVSTLYRLVKPKDGLPHINVRGTGIRFTQANIDQILAESQRGRSR